MTRILSVACLAALLTASAHADLKMVQTTTINNPQITAALQSMSAQQRAQVQKSGSPFFQNGPQVTTIYVHGKKSRLDYGGFSFIADTGTHQLLTLNRATHTFSMRPLSAQDAAGPSGATVRDTHQTKMILGHLVHHYIVATANVAGAGSQLKADIWAAPDLSQPAAYGQSSGVTAPMQALMRRVKGLPLETTIVLAGSPLGTVTAKSVVRSVSTAPVSPALFAVPAGFHPGPTGSNLMGGMQMGQ